MWYKSITRVLLLTLFAVVCAMSQPEGGRSSTTVIRFMPNWSNTNAILIYNGTETIMTAVKNYCGWFETKVKDTPASGFEVTFKQTIGNTYVTADGPEIVPSGSLPVGAPISLDTLKAKGDTLWIIANPVDAPELYAAYPNRLGECPVRILSVMMFDWLHGEGCDGIECKDSKPYANGAKDVYFNDPIYAISNDFGSGGCSGSYNNYQNNAKDQHNTSYMSGMVEQQLGANGAPVRAHDFPEHCLLTEHLDYWFQPLVIGKDAAGKQYTNATCRDVELKLTDKGFWEGKKDGSSKEGGFFLLDDFEFLDDAKTVKNIFFDTGTKAKDGKNHNFGFTMKVQAKFEYVKGQEFEFFGDDDVWVFINKRLVVDLGGQHSQVRGSVNLDTLGLVEGQEYPFHIFYVERHTGSSNFMMRTSMDLHTDASIFLTDTRSTPLLKNYDVWQIVKKDALSCNFDMNEGAQVDTVEGPSNYRLTGGKLGEAGVLLDKTGEWWFEGIYIEDTWDKFSIDSARIVENNALAPGHYYLEVSLKSNPEQKAGVWITIPPYKVPTLVFATENWKELGSQVLGDTLQIGEWAYETYKVQVMFKEEWATVTLYNQNISLSSSDPQMSILNEEGKPISKVILDSTGRATFYVRANTPITGATLQAKGTAASAAAWSNLIFKEPPIPRITSAKIFDRNGDGRGDSVCIKFNKELGGKSSLDSLKFAFGEGFPVQKKGAWKTHNNNTEITIVSSETCEPYKSCGFSSLVFTGGKDDVYTGAVDTWFTYTEGGKEYNFHINADPLEDGVNPIVTQAVKSITKNGHVLSLTFSEAITDETKDYYKEMFNYVCVRAGEVVDPDKPIGYDNGSNRSKMDLLFSMATYDAIVPSVGDSVGFVPGVGGSTVNVAEDMSQNKPHKYTPKVRISGDQEMEITGPDVRGINPDNPIIKDTTTTQTFLVTNKDVDAKYVSDSLGVHGHLIGFDVAELISSQTAEEIAALDALITELLNGGKDDTTITVTEISREEATTQLIELIKESQVTGFSDEVFNGILEGTITADNYKTKLKGDDLALFNEYVESGIEASRDTVYDIKSAADKNIGSLFQDIIDGTITEKELKKNGVSDEVIEAIKNGTITASNIDQYRDGTLNLVSPDDVKLQYETKYFTHLGHYVGGSSGVIMCSDKSVYGEEGCLVNNGNLFLSWNMRSDNGRLAGTGVYIARLHMKIIVGKKTASNITRDLLWGVRRGGKNEIDLGSMLPKSSKKSRKK